MTPVARKRGLVVRELPNELIVYDLDRHRAHCLNRTAAIVFSAADGRHSTADLAALLGAGEEVVEMALGQLTAASLLERDTVLPPGSGVSRREVLRRVGLGAAVLLPLVTSVLAPGPAEAAASCVTDCLNQPNGTPCTCFGVDPCTAVCITDACSDLGGC